MILNTKTSAIIGAAILLAGTALIYVFTRAPEASGGTSGVVRLSSAQPTPPLPVPAHSAAKPPPAVKAALALPDKAILREPIRSELMGGIVCGDVSLSGDPREYRRFVFNGSGGTGGYDDGTEIFRKFADKICLLQPRR